MLQPLRLNFTQILRLFQLCTSHLATVSFLCFPLFFQKKFTFLDLRTLQVDFPIFCWSGILKGCVHLIFFYFCPIFSTRGRRKLISEVFPRLVGCWFVCIQYFPIFQTRAAASWFPIFLPNLAFSSFIYYQYFPIFPNCSTCGRRKSISDFWASLAFFSLIDM